MEYYWNTLFKNSTSTYGSNGGRGYNGHFNGDTSQNHAWESSSWDLTGINDNGGGGSGDSRGGFCNYYPLHNSPGYAPTTAAAAGEFHAPTMHEQERIRGADPHLTCLKLGKRNYFEDVASPPMAEVHAAAAAKKGRSYNCSGAGPSADAAAPRCQVEGCESALANAKDYHRRHKVCEMHAKAPRVVVLGIEQRFCQQCSRFHAVGEFDESKRSCRRRLAGHNERRRKSSQEHLSLSRKHSQDIKMMSAGTHPHFPNTTSECALSLLSSSSSTNYIPWNLSQPSDDLPARCSAALRELIAENRASVLACRQLISSYNQVDGCSSSSGSNAYKASLVRAGPAPLESSGHVTLDLMHDPDSAFGLLSVHDHHQASKEAHEEGCSELWKVPLGY